VLVRPAATRPAPTANGSNATRADGGAENSRPRAVRHSANSTAASVMRTAAANETTRRPMVAGTPSRPVNANAATSSDHSTSRPSGRKLPSARYVGTDSTTDQKSRNGFAAKRPPFEYTLNRWSAPGVRVTSGRSTTIGTRTARVTTRRQG
jgi:hypothetical protein